MRHGFVLTCALLAVLWTVSANADDATPITLTVTQDQAKVSDALNVIQQESGSTIVVDPTVIGRMGSAKVSFATLPKMLDFLKTMEPGLTYRQIYITQGKPTPTADACFDLVRTMEWLSEQGNPVLVSPVGTITISEQSTSPAATPSGMREIWYVSDEQIRAQQVLDQQKLAQQAADNAARAQAAPTPANTYPQPMQGPYNRQRQYQLAPGLVIQR